MAPSLAKQLFLSAFFVIFIASSFAQRDATLLEHPGRIRIQPVKAFNSKERETNLCITPDGNTMLFMSLRGQRPWSKMDYMDFQGQMVADGDIWYSTKSGGKWQEPQSLPYGINTSKGEDEPIVSPDGQTIYFQSWNDMWELTKGPYYYTTLSTETGDWGLKEPLGGGIHQFFAENIEMRATDGMSISPDGQTFLVACGQEYGGPMDIYISHKKRLGWSYLRKLAISTDADERSLFIAADGKTLYFASEGYGGFGGLDIFKIQLHDDGTLGEVINLGEPINTPDDDYGFILSGDGKEGYFIRDGDIYFADLTDADPRIRPGTQHTYFGTLRDAKTGAGIRGEVVLLDMYTKKVVQRIPTDARGDFRVILDNKDQQLLQIAKAPGHENARERLHIEGLSYANLYESEFSLQPFEQTTPVSPPLATQEKPTPPKPKAKLQGMGSVEADNVTLETGDVNDITGMEIPENYYDFTGVAKNNLVLLIDNSASMKQSARLPILKEAFLRMGTYMRVDDQVTIIAYNNEVQVHAEAVSATQSDEIDAAIRAVSAYGGTRGKKGLRQAYRLAEKHFIPGGNNRIILATDGVFRMEDLANIAAPYRDRIRLSVFSFGKIGPDRRKMFDEVAEAGGGNHQNITRKNIDINLLKEAKAVKKP